MENASSGTSTDQNSNFGCTANLDVLDGEIGLAFFTTCEKYGSCPLLRYLGLAELVEGSFCAALARASHIPANPDNN